MNKKIYSFIRITSLACVVFFSLACMFFAYLSRNQTNAQQSMLEKLKQSAGNMEHAFFDKRYNLYRENNINSEAFSRGLASNEQKGIFESKHIAVLEVDDRSLEKIGRWPWSRETWANVLQKIKQTGASVLVFDVMFSEPERACNAEDPDGVFASSLQDFIDSGGKVVLPYSLADYGDPRMEEVPGELYDQIMDSEVVAPPGFTGTEETNPNQLFNAYINRTTFPLEKLRVNGMRYGFLNTSPDGDGVFRHFKVLANVDNLYFPSLALAAYHEATGQNTKISIDQAGVPVLEFQSGAKLPLNGQGESRVKFLGALNHFKTLSVMDLMDREPASIDNVFQDKVVFIAMTAVGSANDIRATPIDPATPGVLMHMNLLHSLLAEDFFKDWSESLIYSLIIMLVGVLTIVLVQMLKNPLFDVLTLLTVIAGVLVIDQVYFLPHSYEIKLLFCITCFILCYVVNTFINFYMASKEKAHIRGAFSKMVAKDIVDELLKDPDKLKLGGEKKDITVFFSDVRDFTTISEKLSPEQLSHALNIYMTAMTDILLETSGTLDKYIGDAIVGYWGAPVPLKNHAYHAVRASVEMLQTLQSVNDRLKKENLPEFKVGIGLNSGVCSVGNMGSDKIFQYTALGDNMNLGARCEGLCKPYHAKLIITEFTYNQMNPADRDKFPVRRLDKVKVKGKEKAVEILEIFDNSHPLFKRHDFIAAFNESFEHYLERNFQKAKDILEKFTTVDDFSAKEMIRRCNEFLKNPPPEAWDGAKVMTTK